ncbi:hypothetical protein BBJ28_00005103 [Nothophytophthora sp. Chile5]|nr:hypothetical protein BBJ28_00005103 [Nothophytophthora sp. Chile5]
MRSAPQLPRQFQAQVEVLSHLTDPRQDYPPSVGRMKVHYDFDQQLARAEMLEGYGAGKTFVRRYDQVEIALTRLECAVGWSRTNRSAFSLQKQEFMVKHGEYRKCERAYLGDAMPQPEIPFTQEFVSVRGKVCEHWVHSNADVRVHVFSDVSTDGTAHRQGLTPILPTSIADVLLLCLVLYMEAVPIRLTEENVVDGQPTMLLTYDLLDVQLGPQNVSSFDIPDGYEHSDCLRSAGGFPYIHAFHYYLRF